MICPHCTFAVQPTDAFCGHCGAALPGATPADSSSRHAAGRGGAMPTYPTLPPYDASAYPPPHQVADEPIAYEALVRWFHPTQGVVSPAEFIEVAEESGLIVPIGSFVLHEACRQLKRWQTEHPDKHPDYVSVNLSVRQFQRQGQTIQLRADLGQGCRGALGQRKGGAHRPRPLQEELDRFVLLDGRLLESAGTAAWRDGEAWRAAARSRAARPAPPAPRGW